MTRDDFWRMISEARGDDDDERVEILQRALAGQTPDEIVEFERHLRELMVRSYGWPLWGAAYLINGGCSDDGFDYFRAWFVMQGQHVFERALADPDSLADLEQMEMDEVECEPLLYAAWEVYEKATGRELPNVRPSLPELGQGWDFDDDAEMKRRYPRLFARFCES